MIFNKENIANYLQDDAQLMAADSKALKQFVEKHPYSGLLQLIYCKYLHLHNDIKLEQQLEKCSLAVSDRKKVYEILFKEGLQQQIIEHEANLVVENTIKEVKLENSVIIEKTETLTKETEVKVDKVEKTISNIDELEQNILNEAINSSIQIDINDYAKDDKNIAKKIKEEIIPEERERTFIHWFDKPRTNIKVKSDSSIIDSYLKDSKNKEKISPSILSSSEMAKMSLVANTQFVTETLATIYVKQGQIDKAIEIYEQLSLKNPEKKTFFASRIRFLKEKQQYNN